MAFIFLKKFLQYIFRQEYKNNFLNKNLKKTLNFFYFFSLK